MNYYYCIFLLIIINYYYYIKATLFFSLQLLCVFNARSYSCSILIETVGACQERKKEYYFPILMQK